MSDSRILLTRDRNTTSFSAAHPPALEVDPGALVTFETGDEAYRRLADGEAVDDIGLENFNRVTGPVRIRGAAPGDALRVDVLEVEIERAWSVWLPGFGGLGGRTDAPRVMPTPPEGGHLRISEGLRVPLEPMIGCIGVAPASGEASTFRPAHPTGGNMDLRELSPGATVWLPVEVEGALLSVGDLHAAMGRAEPTWVSLEAAGRATVRVDVEAGVGRGLPAPRLRREDVTLCLGLGDSLEEAHDRALGQAYDLLVEEHGLEPFEAYAYASARVGMRLGGPASPMVLAEVPDP